MSINRLPILIWGTLTASVGQSSCRALRQPRLLPAVDGPPVRHAFLRRRRRRPAAAVAASVLDVRPSLGLCDRACPPWASCPMRCRCSAAARSSATRCVALATVATMVLGFGVWVHHMFATGLPVVALSFFSAASHHHRHPERDRGFCLDRDDLDRAAAVRHGLPVLRRLHLAVRHRRRIRLHDRLRAGRLATDRHLFRGRASALCADRHQRVSRRGRAAISGSRK